MVPQPKMITKIVFFLTSHEFQHSGIFTRKLDGPSGHENWESVWRFQKKTDKISREPRVSLLRKGKKNSATYKNRPRQVLLLFRSIWLVQNVVACSSRRIIKIHLWMNVSHLKIILLLSHQNHVSFPTRHQEFPKSLQTPDCHNFLHWFQFEKSTKDCHDACPNASEVANCVPWDRRF